MVHIIDDWYFIPDGTQYILMRKYKETKKNRKGQGQIFGYYTSLDHLLKCLTNILVSDEVKEGKVKTISEYIVAYRTAARELIGRSSTLIDWMQENLWTQKNEEKI